MSWFSVMVCSLAPPILVGASWAYIDVRGGFQRLLLAIRRKHLSLARHAYPIPCRVDSVDVAQPSGLPFFQCDAVTSGLALAVPAASFASAAGKNDTYWPD